MKKHTEKPPIDDLFAQKLGNMSLPPSPHGFERLKARMGQGEQRPQVVFWRNPSVQRYMAAAACLLLVCLFGWLYRPSSSHQANGNQLATNQLKTTSPPTHKQIDQASDKPNMPTVSTSGQPVSNSSQLAQVDKISEDAPASQLKNRVPAANRRLAQRPQLVDHAPELAPLNSIAIKAASEQTNPDKVVPTNSMAIDQIATAKMPVKTVAPAEHVLEVTIAEPEALVAARQIAKTTVEEKSVVATNDKPEQESKSGGLWQQVKRIKQGEVFARRDNSGDDDRGLLGKAYTGLKHSFEKDKPTKQ